jgi:hypothetical protein
MYYNGKGSEINICVDGKEMEESVPTKTSPPKGACRPLIGYALAMS